jgi:large subunit ribosomal protein L30
MHSQRSKNQKWKRIDVGNPWNRLNPSGLAESENMMAKTVKITLVKSPIGYSKRHKNTVRALGLRKVNQTVEQEDTDVLRGMLSLVNHLVVVEE